MRINFFFGAIALALVVLSLPALVWAHSINIDKSVNNYYYTTELTEITENMSITSGKTGAQLAAGISAAMAAGSHQFDWSTTDYQLSATIALHASGENENNASVAIAKKFNDSFLPNALFHGSYTPIGNDDYFVFGATIRF